jgi:hypothetical protein
MKKCLHWYVTLAILAFGASAEASTMSVLIGDRDGFGGTQACNPCAPGDPFVNLAAPAIVPGMYLDTFGMDATTIAPWTPYIFQFTFLYDASAFASLTSATVTIQTGSLALRSAGSNGTGFGLAFVTGDNGSGPINLGQFLTVSTGTNASAAEESVKHHRFDVLSLLSLTGPTTLTIVVNGAQLNQPVDQFSIDWAELMIDGTITSGPSPVPEPGSSTLLALGLLGIARTIRRRRPL